MNIEELEKEVSSLIRQRDQALALYHKASGALEFAKTILEKLKEEKE